MPGTRTPARILVVGGGYVGYHAARRLEGRMRTGEATVTLVNPDNFLTYRPLLPEVAAGSLEPRHAVVPLRDALPRTRFVAGRLTGLSPAHRTATVHTYAGSERGLSYDHLVLAPGGMTKTMPVPGLADQAIGFTTLTEAIALRNHLLSRFETAEELEGPARRRVLTFVFVGGGYTGVEALAELQDMARDVLRGYPGIRPAELRFVLVEATGRLLPSLPDELADAALHQLRERGIDVRLETTVDDARRGTLRLSDGTVVDTDTLVWVAGVAPQRVVSDLGLPTDDSGRLPVDACLRVPGHPRIWAAGDCAAVPDLNAGGTCPATAQYAVREGRRLGDNLVLAIRGRPPRPFRYSSKGEFVTLGMRRAVGEVWGRPVSGLGAWLLRRGYYAAQIPTVNRKARVLLDWTVRLPFGHDVVDLASQREPHAPLRHAAGASAS